MEKNENMVAIGGSAFFGMSGGPLCRVSKGELYIEAILSGSSTLPMLRALNDCIKWFFTKGWGGFGPLEEDIQEVIELEKRIWLDQGIITEL